MSEDLVNEIAALRSIYGPDVLREEDDAFVYILSIPHREASLRVLLPPDYPKSIPQLLRVERTGPQARKGYGSHVLDTARATLLSVFVPGSVCLFDLLQELDTALADESEGQQPSLLHTGEDGSLLSNAAPSDAYSSLEEDPHWVLSSTVTKKKSTFVARACAVTSPAHAQACVTRLLENDKYTAKATHTISAYRVRTPSATKIIGEVLYEDCDDDGENAAGRRLLRLLQVMDVWNVLVVVSRWYGGVKLGPDRFNIINDVAREAVVDGGWTQKYNEPPPPLRRADGYAADNPDSPRINATLLALVRNEELDGMLVSMRDLERTWNSKFNYPWTFFNDVPFSEDFKRLTQMETKAKCNYELIPKEHWAVPSWINSDLFDESAKMLEEQEVQYGPLVSYHQMCRWNSGMFYKHPALKDIRYYWRVEPKVHFFCDIDYDIFRWMNDHNKTYGFTINLYDAPQTIPTLWPETEKFMAAHPEYLHENNAKEWVVDSKRRPEHNIKAHGYSTCHFWSNFEIGDMDFWRSKPYEDYFEHLDRAGGFFYERWGDAPVHSIALGLFEDKSKIHWFRDIGYQHIPYFNCPKSPKCKGCVSGRFTDGERFLFKEDCRPNWFKYVGMD